MRRKKTPPPPPDAVPLNPTDDPQTPEQERADVIATIRQLDGVLAKALPTSFACTPSHLIDLGEMFLALMFFKRVRPSYYAQHTADAFRLIELCARVSAELDLLQTEDLSETATKTLKGAMDLSVQEIKVVRENLVKELELLQQIPLPGTTIH
jgi:hypothetical protein